MNAVRTDFEQAPWHMCSLFEDLDDTTWAWEKTYKEIMKEHVPKRKAKIRTDSLPWMNASVIKCMDKRYKQLFKANQTKDPEDWKKYRELRSYTTKLCRVTESNYWKTKLENAKTDKRPRGLEKVQRIENYTTKLCRVTESNYWKTKLENAKTDKRPRGLEKVQRTEKLHH